MKRTRPVPISGKLEWLLAAALFTFPSLLPAADENGTTRIGVMLFDGVLTSDVIAPLEVFGHAIGARRVEGYEVVTVAPRAGGIRTFEGIMLHGDYSLDDAPALDAIIVGSSYDMDTILEDEAFMTFIRARGAEVDWLASNCSGAYILAEAGVLKGGAPPLTPAARYCSSSTTRRSTSRSARPALTLLSLRSRISGPLLRLGHASQPVC